MAPAVGLGSGAVTAMRPVAPASAPASARAAWMGQIGLATPGARPSLSPHSCSRLPLGCLAAGAATLTAVARRQYRTQRAAEQKKKNTPSFVDAPEDFSAIAEYKNLKANALTSWGFLEESDFSLRLLGLFGVNLLLGLALESQVYPPNSFANVVVGGLFGVAIAFSLLFFVLLIIIRPWDSVNKMLLRKSYVVEARKDYAMGDGGAYAYNQVKTKRDARRDRLLAGYTTGPVLSRLRVYTLAAFALSVTTWGGGAVVGGEMDMQKDVEEEEDDGMYRQTRQKMDQPGLGYFLERD